MIDQCDISLICTICYSIHEDASFLTSCGHEFCDSCIRQWIDHAGSNPTCPMCRLPTSSSNVKPSHIIRGLIHEFRTEQNNEYGHLLTSPHFDVDKDITDRFSRLLNGNDELLKWVLIVRKKGFFLCNLPPDVVQLLKKNSQSLLYSNNPFKRL